VANTLRLLDLPTHIQDAVASDRITESHGRLLLTVSDPEARERLFEDILRNRVTTRELRHKMRAPHRAEEGAPREEERPPRISPELAMLQEKLSAELGAPVEISCRGDTGKIVIEFYSEEELRNIVGRLGPRGE
jgi:ParB family chromosome partitioning protein